MERDRVREGVKSSEGLVVTVTEGEVLRVRVAEREKERLFEAVRLQVGVSLADDEDEGVSVGELDPVREGVAPSDWEAVSRGVSVGRGVSSGMGGSG